ncbi:MAG: 2OG-Fe(II) oxygenase family protein [Candidatus Neomarinimicrobiota bacterium]|nr:2OG-Fe(II) oxygenase family protein [Candidatus Neomarinimicrobiota bacterium]
MSLDILTINYNDSDADRLFEKSLKNTGFAVIKDHPIDKDLIGEVYKEWENYFSSESKNDYMFDEVKQDGYFPYLTENAKGSTAKDLKEFYHIYEWGRKPHMIGPKTMFLYRELTNVASTLLSWIQKNSPENVSKLFSVPLKDMIYKSQYNLLRIIHYPPLSGNEELNSIRAAAHEDINLLTVLVAGSQPGLQVLDNNESWLDVTTDKNTIVINSGDMLNMASDNYYPSTTHRVINPDPHSNVSRYSMPLFLHPRDEVVLNENYTAGSYLQERLEEIGLK